VDDARQPGSAFIRTSIHSEDSGTWGFLAGNPDNQAFNQALNQAIRAKEAVGANSPVLLLTSDPQDWHSRLGALTAPLPPIPFPRRHYVCRKLALNWQSALPAGFQVAPITRRFLENPSLEIPGDVQDVLKRWFQDSQTPPRDFGFAALQENRIVSWATIDFVTGGMGDAGVFTLEDYRRKGLALAVCGAAMEHAFSQGLTEVHWTCDEQNLGSIRIAERLGCERSADYQMHYILFDPARHYGTYAYQQVSQGAYVDALAAFNTAFETSRDHPGWVYYHAARAAAATGNHPTALQWLEMAANRGWRDAAQASTCPEFESLQACPEWARILERMGEAG
jgi:RimJ/RimL family protein N-acetyltransferase